MAAVAAKGRTATERGLRAHVQDLARALAAMGAETKASAPTSTPSRVGGPPRRVVRH
jgi:UDP-N-acetylglucosamine enolpyruvyl transferase